MASQTPARRPAGARQRTSDRTFSDNQPNDYFNVSESSIQAAELTRNRRRGTQPRVNTLEMAMPRSRNATSDNQDSDESGGLRLQRNPIYESSSSIASYSDVSRSAVSIPPSTSQSPFPSSTSSSKSPFTSATSSSKQSMSPFLSSTSSSRQSLRPNTPKTVLDTSVPNDSVPPSPSRMHWAQVRQAVSPVISGSPVHSQNSSQQQLPKASRALNFMQVVDQVRAVKEIDTDLGRSVLQACWIARYGELKVNESRGPTFGFAPPVAPFTVSTTFRNPLKKPTVDASLQMNRRGSLRQLHSIIINTASNMTRRPTPGNENPTSQFPHQPLVLSVLLLPFVSHDPSWRVDEERWLSVEAFEFLVKAWRSPSLHNEFERWMWCCQAASSEGLSIEMRVRILSALVSILFPHEPVFLVQNPSILQALLECLYLIFPTASDRGSELIKEQLRVILTRIREGTGVHLLPAELETEYGVRMSSQDKEEELRAGIIVEAALRMTEYGSEMSRRWYLLYLVEDQWPISKPRRVTPLLAQVTHRKLLTCTRSILAFIRAYISNSLSMNAQKDAAKIFNILHTRVLPELQTLSEDLSMESRSNVVSIVLELLQGELEEYQGVLLLRQWISDQNEWRESFHQELKRIILHEEWPIALRIVHGLRRVAPAANGASFSPILISSLYERLADEPKFEPMPELTQLLSSLAEEYPQLFYKPMFACAASSKPTIVTANLRILTALANYFPGFWIANDEMMCIALMNDVGVGVGKGKAKQGAAPKWGKARLGQCVLFLELISYLRMLNKMKKDETSVPPASLSKAAAFFSSLEVQISVLLEAKEEATLFPFSIRLLISSLLMEIRRFTRSLKPARWLNKMIEWACTVYSGAIILSKEDPFNEIDSKPPSVPVTDDVFLEVDMTIDSIRELYSSSWLETVTRKQNGLLLTPLLGTGSGGRVVKSSELERNLATLASLPSPAVSIFQLLVLVSGLLSQEDYAQLGPILWHNFLDKPDPVGLGAASFLLMQSAEKDPTASLVATIGADLQGESLFLKQRAVVRLSVLFSWRYQVLFQPVIYDRAHRRPFKSGRPPLPFVPTDVGSTYFVPDQEPVMERLNFASTLPMDIRRRLIELGWDRDTSTESKKPEKLIVPLSVLPADRLNPEELRQPLHGAGVGRGLLRRKSSTGAAGGSKKRPVFVPAIAGLLPILLDLAIDKDPDVSCNARMFLLDVIRDDPTLFSRPILEQLANFATVPMAVSSLERSLKLQSTLPSAFTHLVFNHLAGLLRTLSRDMTSEISPLIYAYTLPVISKTVSMVSALSIRELRKAKLDPMLLPSGSLWFSDKALSGPMFPRSLPKSFNPFQPLPIALVKITMIRTSQNFLLYSLLKRDPTEVHIVRKSFTNFVLPSLDPLEQLEQRLELRDFIPGSAGNATLLHSLEERHLHVISLALSRSHLLLVAQIFRCLNRQTNDQAEIAKLLGGVNRILWRHGNDVGVVSHAMINYMLAATRFRRMFSASGGFMLVMPAVWKVYCDAEGGHKGIRESIEYAAHRFHAIHGDNFIFQSIDVAANVISHPNTSFETREKIASNVAKLFECLVLPTKVESVASGIHSALKPYEQEAVMSSLNDTPEILINSINNGETMDAVVDHFEGKQFPPDNLARLFITVVADDPSILRAEKFLVLFRHMIPALYNASMPTRGVVRDGIEALGTAVFSRAGAPKGAQKAKPQVPETPSSQRPVEDVGGMEGDIYQRPNSPSDFVAMRREYLLSIVSFTKSGGQLPPGVIENALELLKIVIRENGRVVGAAASLFLKEFTESSLLRESKPGPKQAVALLKDVPALVKSHGYAIDFSGVFDVLTTLSKDDLFSSDPTFTHMVVYGFCLAALDALGTAATDNMIAAIQFRRSIISLFIAAIRFTDMDVLSLLERRQPTAGLLAAFVLPICLQLPTTNSIRSGAYALRTSWLRLIGYAISACDDNLELRDAKKTADATTEGERRPSIGTTFGSSRRTASRVAFALQVIKLIVIRAKDDLTLIRPDIWMRIASTVRRVLHNGGGWVPRSQSFPVDLSGEQLISQPTTPPRRSFDTIPGRSSTDSLPKVVDYLTWSLLELICFYRTPLNIQLRLWLQERLLKVDQHADNNGGSPIRVSVGVESRRHSFSPFSKARVRSGIPSASASPDVSPSLRPYQASGNPSGLTLDPTARGWSAYDRFPQASPSPEFPTHPKIRHLGPSFNPGGRESPTLATEALITGVMNSVAVERPRLIKDTTRRMTAVRIFWGYESFSGDDMTPFEAWTEAVAVKKIVNETRELSWEYGDLTRLEVEDNFHLTV